MRLYVIYDFFCISDIVGYSITFLASGVYQCGEVKVLKHCIYLYVFFILKPKIRKNKVLVK